MNEKTKQTNKKLAVFYVILALLMCTVGVYAWFTANNTANTNRVTTKTAVVGLSLLVDEKGGADFVGSDECDIVQVNVQDVEQLFPVSTNDLNNFVVQVTDKTGVNYKISENESLYYHGQIYIKAEGNGLDAEFADLYLDDIDNLFVADDDSKVLNATRVGLAIKSLGSSAIIRPSEAKNDDPDRVYNTYVDGELQGDNIVLSWNGSGVEVVKDPSESPSAYYIENAEAKPIAQLKLNEIYLMDIYFYLEGCDPDCSNAITSEGSTMHFAFFAVPEGVNE